MTAQESTSIMENEHVRELLDLLKLYQPPGGTDLINAVQQISDMERRLAEATDELKAMRQEVQKMQESRLKTSLQKTNAALEKRIHVMHEKLAELKSNIVEGCKRALAEVKAKGAAALNGIARFFHIRPLLESLRADMTKNIEADNRAIAKIQAYSKEFHKAGQHIRNMGRAVRGKELIQEEKPNGRLSKALEAPYRAGRSYHRRPQACGESPFQSGTAGAVGAAPSLRAENHAGEQL